MEPREVADGQLARNRSSGDAARPQKDNAGQEQLSSQAMTLELIAQRMGLVFFSELRPDMIKPEAIIKVPEAVARGYQIIPIAYDPKSGQLTIATNDPDNLDLTDKLRFEIDCNVIILSVACAEDIGACIEAVYTVASNCIPAIEAANKKPPLLENRVGEIILDDNGKSESEIVQIVHALLKEAISKKASDIYIEPQERDVTVRLKIDGQLRVLEPPLAIGWHRGIISHIKATADMDINETRRPLDGSIRVNYHGSMYDIRVATLPTALGETITLRLLDPKNAQRTLSEIGLSTLNIGILNNLVDFANGVILVTGPTGSGKTTTLYACINQVNNDDRKIITIEDPVEYHIPGISQVPVNEKIGLGFAEILRSSLRHNPNIILIGEMRDTETATIAMRAAMTGHLVFSTLHTNDAVSTVARLIDMGVPSFMIAQSLRAVVAQRLIRKLCAKCSKTKAPAPELMAALGIKLDADLSRAKSPIGCLRCYLGYSGLTGIHEIMVCSDEIKAAITSGSSAIQLQTLVVKAGMVTLKKDGCRKALAGLTSLEEVLRVTLGN